jgi:hypothetical protein
MQRTCSRRFVFKGWPILTHGAGQVPGHLGTLDLPQWQLAASDGQPREMGLLRVPIGDAEAPAGRRGLPRRLQRLDYHFPGPAARRWQSAAVPSLGGIVRVVGSLPAPGIDPGMRVGVMIDRRRVQVPGHADLDHVGRGAIGRGERYAVGGRHPQRIPGGAGRSSGVIAPAAAPGWTAAGRG